ncbi:flagellar basal body rod protein FlgB [Bacillus sp. OK048]|uniref:flagellar basal body rod protein FlgB n=1 Tax=Bacillus sp. OK048 TaxID=1882761 RepID=UPI000B8895D9|nr:flagellar basal body rod protein FlgB [Bacillus sp. OK048]
MNQMIGIMSRALDASSLRQKSISNNIANVNTPNFKPTKVSFEELLQQEVKSQFIGNRSNAKHVLIGETDQIPSPKLEQGNAVFQNSGNGVDLDYEMAKLSENTIWYQSLTYGLNEEFNLLKTAIRAR